VYKFAIYIKSRIGRGASIENITVRDMDAARMRMGFLRIDQTNAGNQDANPVPGLEGLPLFRNFRFENIRVENAPVLVNATELASDKPLDGLVLQGISGTCTNGISIANARNVRLKNISVTGYTGPLLCIANATGHGLEEATRIPSPARPSLGEMPPTTYKLH
jgi:hypothetical protein